MHSFNAGIDCCDNSFLSLVNGFCMNIPQAQKMQNQCVGIASILRKAQLGEDITKLALSDDGNPNDANFIMGLSMIFRSIGNLALGLELQRKALAMQQLYHEPPARGNTAIKLLAIMRPGDLMENTPVDFLLQDSDVALDSLYVSPDLPFPTSLPDHDVLFIAIGHGDENRQMLEKLTCFLRNSTRPVLNKPEKIICLSRDRVSSLLKTIPMVEIPISVRTNRSVLQQISLGNTVVSDILKDGGFPFIVRPLESHGGKGLARLESPLAIADYLNVMSEDEFFVARFVEYRSADGCYRKYRVALIEGQAFACHMAISDNWVVHYNSAGMSESADKRAEEERFMQNFDLAFGLRHKASFHAIHQLTGLDYLVIDCGETADGKLLIFEVDNAGYVHAMDPIDVYPYKQPQMRKVFKAFCAMLTSAHSCQSSISA